jgi:Zn-dependent M28 family amino/carboxypeptidase
MRHRPVLLAVALAAAAVTSPAADASRLRTTVQTLASERLGGRLTGTEGEALARQFIVSELKRIGAKPLPGRNDYESPFEFTAGSRDGGSTATFSMETNGVSSPGGPVQGGVVFGFAPNQTRALSFSDNGDVEGSVVFAGYGIVVPDSQDFGYDSYASLDVKDKVVLVLRYFPEDADQKTKGVLSRYADLRYKAMAARQHGAKAMLVVTGPNSPNAGELAPMTFDTAIAGSGILALSISGSVANALFAKTDKTLADAQKGLDSGNPHVAGFPLAGIRARVHADVVRETRTGHNIVAYLPATTGGATAAKPWVAIGAHYDHLGHGENGSSLAAKEDAGKVHGGADDNASGTAAVLALAETLSKEPRHRNVAVNFWSGEELGLLGSAAFASRPLIPIADIAAYLNFDMVGRMQDNKLNVQASGSSPVWDKLIEQANVKAGFDLRLQPDPYQPTDVQTFNLAGVPNLNFFTGSHVDYHKPSDTADKIDYDDLERIVDFAAAIIRRLDASPDAPAFTKVEPQAQGGASRAGVRLFTGTIPDYASDAKGLLLGGVVGGGPAEQAGLQKGDVIIEIAGQTITNIYDYTYALEVLKISQPAKVVYIRNGERKETTLTPSARK